MQTELLSDVFQQVLMSYGQVTATSESHSLIQLLFTFVQESYIKGMENGTAFRASVSGKTVHY